MDEILLWITIFLLAINIVAMMLFVFSTGKRCSEYSLLPKNFATDIIKIFNHFRAEWGDANHYSFEQGKREGRRQEKEQRAHDDAIKGV